MGFNEEYKRLEKLCGEIFNDNHGVSAFIDEMKHTPKGAYFVNGWNTDLKRLEYYRRIRNQIAHDPGCSEENMCDDDDTQWIIDFHARIMNQTDPLTLYRTATQTRQKPVIRSVEEQNVQEQIHTQFRETTQHLGFFVALFSISAVIIALLLWLLW